MASQEACAIVKGLCSSRPCLCGWRSLSRSSRSLQRPSLGSSGRCRTGGSPCLQDGAPVRGSVNDHRCSVSPDRAAQQRGAVPRL